MATSHRKNFSEVPKLKLTPEMMGVSPPPFDSKEKKHKKFESDIPHFKIQTTCSITDRVSSDRLYNYTEHDTLKDKISPRDVKLLEESKRPSTTKSAGKKSVIFSELK